MTMKPEGSEEHELQRTAYHEGAHLVVSRLAGFSPATASLAPDDRSLGHVELLTSANPALHPDILRSYMAILLAGGWGEVVLDPSGIPGHGDDREKVERIARAICGAVASWGAVQDETNRADDTARRVVFAHAAEIRAVAESLLRHHKLLEGIRPLAWPFSGLFRPETTQEV